MRAKCPCGGRAIGVVITTTGSELVCQECYQAECRRYAKDRAA